MTAVIDYDAGNIRSVEKALHFLGQECIVTRNHKELAKADRLILPGVGSFGDAMGHLKEYGLDVAIRELVAEGKPLLGICLGLQLLFDGSVESGGVEGLHILKGDILRIPDSEGLKIPHIGWNSLTLLGEGRLFAGFPAGPGTQPYAYFVHSYYLSAADISIVKAVTEYGVRIHASVEKGNVFACQFHPEKSGAVGLRILQNFSVCAAGE